MGKNHKQDYVPPNWNDVFGAVDFTQFTSKQNMELTDGQHAGLPVQFFADPAIPEQKMRDIREMLEIICFEFRSLVSSNFSHDLSTHWDNLLGPIDLTFFTDDQLTEIHEGRYLDLPVQLYADPSFSSQKMYELRMMLETSRAVLTALDGVRYVCTDYGPEQLHVWFRSDSNFVNHPQRVCYVPENWDFDDGPGITGQEIVALCGGDQLKAEIVFGLCDWQFPSTILDEWDHEDEAALEALRIKRSNPLEHEPLSNRLKTACNRRYVQVDSNSPLAEKGITR